MRGNRPKCFTFKFCYEYQFNLLVVPERRLFYTCITTSLTYIQVYMGIIETSIFPRKIRELVSKQEFDNG